EAYQDRFQTSTTYRDRHPGQSGGAELILGPGALGVDQTVLLSRGYFQGIHLLGQPELNGHFDRYVRPQNDGLALQNKSLSFRGQYVGLERNIAEDETAL